MTQLKTKEKTMEAGAAENRSAKNQPAEDQSLPAGALEDLSVEEAFEELERLVHRMEEDGISLEESFACYEKGVRLVRLCNERIDRVEKKVQILRGEGEAGEYGEGF